MKAFLMQLSSLHLLLLDGLGMRLRVGNIFGRDWDFSWTDLLPTPNKFLPTPIMGFYNIKL